MSASVVRLAEFVNSEEELSSQARALIEYTINVPPKRRITRQTVVEQFNETFQLIGGVPRLALWADQNPSQFFSLYSKLLPASIKAEMLLPQGVDDMTPEQIKELSTDQLKYLLLVKAGESAEDVELSLCPESNN
jgi:hypothetical protein